MEYASDEERERIAAITQLERALERQLFSNEAAKIPLRLDLAVLYQQQRRFAEAEIAARAGLDTLRRLHNPADTLVLQVELTRALSEAIESQGKTREAAAIRTRVDALLMTGNQTSAWHQAQATSLEREGKYIEAASHYLSAEAKMPPRTPASLRAHLLTEASCLIHAGEKYEESLELALRAVAVHDGNATQITAYRQAAVAAMAIDHLEDATHYQNKSCAAALRTRNRSLIASADAQMAHLALIKGLPDEALGWAQNAAREPGAHHRLIRAVRYEAYMAKKQYADALAILQERSPEEEYALTYQNKIADSGNAMAAAPAYIALGRYEQALEALAIADRGIGHDEQAAGIISALRILAKAYLIPDAAELRQEARNLLHHFHHLAARRGGNYIPQRSALETLVRAAFQMGDDRTVLEASDAFAKSLPRPGGWSLFHFHRGESLRRLNRLTESRAAFEQSVAANDDAEFIARARAGLTKLA